MSAVSFARVELAWCATIEPRFHSHSPRVFESLAVIGLPSFVATAGPFFASPPYLAAHQQEAKLAISSLAGRMVTPGARLRPRRRGTGLQTRLALALAAVAAVVASAAALNFKVQPNDELCFHEITHKGMAVRYWLWGAACFVCAIASMRTVGGWVGPMGTG